MAAAESEEESQTARLQKDMSGPLPEESPRVTTPTPRITTPTPQTTSPTPQTNSSTPRTTTPTPQANTDLLEAEATQMAPRVFQQPHSNYLTQNYIGRLSITCAQAKLVRNYGLTRMDPYCRVRVGHYVYETQTDSNGGKHPRWNRVIQSQLPAGVTSISVELYDECSFKMDELIAWCEIKIPENVFCGETIEDWYPLSGKQGDGLEGTIDIVLSYSNQPIQPCVYQHIPTADHMLMVQSGRPMPVFIAPNTAHQIPSTMTPPEWTEADFKQIHEMFPNIDKEVVKSVHEANNGDKEAIINSLLQINE